MRPARLAPLFATVRSLKGVGPELEGLLNKLLAPRHEGGHARVIDLLWHLPVSVIDRPIAPRITEAKVGELATLEVTVTEHRPGGGIRRGGRSGPYRVLVEDQAGAALELVYFNADPAYLKRLLPEGSRRLISGKLKSYDGWLQMPHPDHVAKLDDARGGAAMLPLHEPVYPLTAGLTNTTLRKTIGEALQRLPCAARSGRTRRFWRSRRGCLSPKHLRNCMRPRPKPICCHRHRRGRVSLMTSCLPISWRWR